MKTVTYTLLAIVLNFNAFCQKPISPQAWQHPIIKQLQNNAPHLVQLNRKKDADYYIPVAILNKQNNLLYYVTTFGEMFDSVAIGPKLSKGLIAKQIDAFETYNKIVTTEELKELGNVRNALREYGLESDKKLPKSNYINYDYYKSLTTTFEKTITLDTYEKTVLHNNILLNLIIEDRKDQTFLNKKSSFENYKPAKIKIHQTKPYGYIEFTTQNKFALLTKAYFYPHSAKVYLHNRLDKLVDSFTINKEKAKEIETEKQDIFALHRMWQEWQIQQVQQEAQALLKQTTNKKIGNANTLTENQQQQLTQLANYYIYLEQKVLYAIMPDKDLLLANIVKQADKYSRKKWIADSGWVVLNPAPETISSFATLSTFTRGEKEYFLTDHRGNVYATVSDRKIPKDDNNDGIIDYYVADVVTASDYAPFGSLLQSRQYRSNGKKLNYGYNSKENDNEVKGEGNQQDYGFRIYDPRLGRFLSIDPLASKFAQLTPYQFASNTPVAAVDIDGREAEVVIDKKAKEVKLNFKFTHDDVLLDVMKNAGVMKDNLVKGFEYFYVPESNGYPKALNNLIEKTGLNKKQLDELVGGEIASGGNGYFNVKYSNDETYKVFFSLNIDGGLSTKDKTVFTLDQNKNTAADGYNYQDDKGIHMVFQAGSNPDVVGLKFGHELGHQGGVPDYGGTTEADAKENPFKTPTVNMKNPYGITLPNSFGELMDKKVAPENRVLSTESILRMISKAIEAAKKIEGNKVTVLSGGSETIYDSKQADLKKTIYKSIQAIISVE